MNVSDANDGWPCWRSMTPPFGGSRWPQTSQVTSVPPLGELEKFPSVHALRTVTLKSLQLMLASLVRFLPCSELVFRMPRRC